MSGTIIDIFHNDAFSALEMTSAVERLPHLPAMLRDLGIFTENPIRTTALAVEERNGVLSIIPTSQRGQPTNFERTTEKRKMRYFDVPRVRVGDTIHAHELQNIRAFGESTVFMQVQDEVARRLSGPTGLLALLDYTEENMFLGAVQGLFLDVDGSVLYNWFDEFGFTAADEIAFNLAANVEFSLRPIITGIIRSMGRAAKGAFTPSTKVMALCGDGFYDAFVNHIDVVKTYYNWQAASELRENKAWQTFHFGGIDWVNYRGSDDNTTIKIPDDKVKFFPVGAPGVFEEALAPAEGFEWINTPGQKRYVKPIFDRDRNEWWRMEASMYPLPICKRPEVLRTGRIGS
ncbi:major capsid protein [uncultured Sphingomonas sp.]|uniref:major capsid protein n=1 Tax=uncultured Sphingomonas sp. TaxID=158754 RepID=UPI00259A266C|nr:major capsid protein [uncultured Sphingomonas sp.]